MTTNSVVYSTLPHRIPQAIIMQLFGEITYFDTLCSACSATCFFNMSYNMGKCRSRGEGHVVRFTWCISVNVRLHCKVVKSYEILPTYVAHENDILEPGNVPPPHPLDSWTVLISRCKMRILTDLTVGSLLKWSDYFFWRKNDLILYIIRYKKGLVN
jgi:hypothetical protein